MPTFLAPLWLCAIYFSDKIAAALALVWIVGRISYFVGHSKAVEKRLPGSSSVDRVPLAADRCNRGYLYILVR